MAVNGNVGEAFDGAARAAGSSLQLADYRNPWHAVGVCNNGGEDDGAAGASTTSPHALNEVEFTIARGVNYESIVQHLFMDAQHFIVISHPIPILEGEIRHPSFRFLVDSTC